MRPQGPRERLADVVRSTLAWGFPPREVDGPVQRNDRLAGARGSRGRARGPRSGAPPRRVAPGAGRWSSGPTGTRAPEPARPGSPSPGSDVGRRGARRDPRPQAPGRPAAASRRSQARGGPRKPRRAGDQPGRRACPRWPCGRPRATRRVPRSRAARRRGTAAKIGRLRDRGSARLAPFRHVAAPRSRCTVSRISTSCAAPGRRVPLQSPSLGPAVRGVMMVGVAEQQAGPGLVDDQPKVAARREPTRSSYPSPDQACGTASRGSRDSSGDRTQSS